MHRSAVQLDEVTDDAKSETQSGMTLRCRIFGLTEALEYVWQEIRAWPLGASASVKDAQSSRT